MPVSAFTKYTAAIEPLLEGINAGTDTWKVALSNAVNVADTTFTAGVTDLATGGGYTQGGNTANVTSATQAAGLYKLILASPAVWTGSGGGFTFRYAILYNFTNLIPVGYWDYGSSQVVAATETVTVTLDGAAGVLQGSIA